MGKDRLCNYALKEVARDIATGGLRGRLLPRSHF